MTHTTAAIALLMFQRRDNVDFEDLAALISGMHNTLMGHSLNMRALVAVFDKMAALRAANT